MEAKPSSSTLDLLTQGLAAGGDGAVGLTALSAEVPLSVYSGARHEIFIQTNRHGITADVIACLTAQP